MAEYISLTSKQRIQLLLLICISIGATFIISIGKDILEEATFLPTLAIGSTISDLFFVGISELISILCEKYADKKGIPNKKSRKRTKIIELIINILPFFSFVRFGIENIPVVLTGRIKVA